ncbi:hypothetical protein LMB49_10900 [Limosilactobacillus reuteri]|uniref:hypothetical protein n=1 Tax=Limosilactobacillus reuteri TaxID=1598 RepID=UPI001E288D8D|nr:hypothetical protein [Limosilactobacillus reuteri]MCC4371898.1 hypothetical protein [Limosilactobacillus reuteri]MCC4509633.1 hypothetical protein [Limosilactobacillus reuteri]
METEETKQIKVALAKHSKALTRHGIQEVTVGHITGGKGYDRCDYVEFDNNGNFYAYEIKISVSDLNSNNKLSYCANKNYLVVNQKVYDWLFKTNNNGQRKVNHEFNSGGFGIILYRPDSVDKLQSVTRCSNRQLGLGERMELLEAIAKSACRDAGKLLIGD